MRDSTEMSIMKKIVSQLLLVLAVAGCATRRYDTHVVALPGAGASAWMIVRVDHQTGHSWYWRGDTSGNSKPEWHPIADASGPHQK
jgi:hypothetical protein